MTRDEIIRMAREAGIDWSGSSAEDVLVRAMQVAYVAGAAAEREECAKICESMDCDEIYCRGFANAIRARGQQ